MICGENYGEICKFSNSKYDLFRPKIVDDVKKDGGNVAAWYAKWEWRELSLS